MGAPVSASRTSKESPPSGGSVGSDGAADGGVRAHEAGARRARDGGERERRGCAPRILHRRRVFFDASACAALSSRKRMIARKSIGLRKIASTSSGVGVAATRSAPSR